MILSFDILCVFLGATLIAHVLIYFWTHRRRRYYYLGHLIDLFYFFGSIENITKMLINFYGKTRVKYIHKFWLGLDLFVVIADPDTVKNIFQEHLQKADIIYKYMKHCTGGSSLIDQNDIPAWKQRRHTILSKSFSFACLEYYNKIFHEESKLLADKMEPLAKSGTSFEPFHLTEKAGFATILRTMCGLNLQIQQNAAHEHAYPKALATGLKIFTLQVAKPWYRFKPLFYLSGLKAQESQARKTIHNFVEDLFNKIKDNLRLEESRSVINADQREQCSPRNLESIAESVLKSHMIPGVQRDSLISYKDLLHEMTFLLGAGYDTTKLTNAFVLILLAMHPKIQQDVYDELISVLGEDPNTTPTNSQLNELQLLDRVIKETLRLFPPAPIVARVADREIQVGQYTIPKGSTMAVLIFGIHRDPRHWPDPTRFDPDRFLPSEAAKRSPNAFMPFSLGPRDCIGKKYAMLSIKITISTILRRYRILPGDKCKSLDDIRFEFGLTMVPLPGNDMRIEMRNP